MRLFGRERRRFLGEHLISQWSVVEDAPISLAALVHILSGRRKRDFGDFGTVLRDDGTGQAGECEAIDYRAKSRARRECPQVPRRQQSPKTRCCYGPRRHFRCLCSLCCSAIMVFAQDDLPRGRKNGDWGTGIVEWPWMAFEEKRLIRVARPVERFGSVQKRTYDVGVRLDPRCPRAGPDGPDSHTEDLRPVKVIKRSRQRLTYTTGWCVRRCTHHCKSTSK
ncbi:hypothetical protein OF83DRAFT_864251 [Amylostereum chailletii]|nr:hypothetical protein OF83DRAFT_864251 [Amylostereum chailletii]